MELEISFEGVYPLYRNGRIKEFEEIHLLDKYVPDDRIDYFLKSFPLYISLGEDNSSVKYLRCNLLDDKMIIEDEDKNKVYSILIKFNGKSEEDFIKFVYDFVHNLSYSELVINSNSISELLNNNFYYDWKGMK